MRDEDANKLHGWTKKKINDTAGVARITRCKTTKWIIAREVTRSRIIFFRRFRDIIE